MTEKPMERAGLPRLSLRRSSVEAKMQSTSCMIFATALGSSRGPKGLFVRTRVLSGCTLPESSSGVQQKPKPALPRWRWVEGPTGGSQDSAPGHWAALSSALLR